MKRIFRIEENNKGVFKFHPGKFTSYSDVLKTFIRISSEHPSRKYEIKTFWGFENFCISESFAFKIIWFIGILTILRVVWMSIPI